MPCNKLQNCQAGNCDSTGLPEVFADNYMFSMTPGSNIACNGIPNGLIGISTFPFGSTYQDFSFIAGTYILSNTLGGTSPNLFYLATNSLTHCPNLLEDTGVTGSFGGEHWTYYRLYTLYMFLSLQSCGAPGTLIDRPVIFQSFPSDRPDSLTDLPAACSCTGWQVVLNIKIGKYSFASTKSADTINSDNIVSQCLSGGWQARMCPFPNTILARSCGYTGEGILLGAGGAITLMDVAELAYVMPPYVKYDPAAPMVLRKACWRDRHNFPNFITVTPL